MNDLIAKGYKNFDSKLSNDETWITRSNRTDLEKTTGFNFLQKSKGCYIFAVDK